MEGFELRLSKPQFATLPLSYIPHLIKLINYIKKIIQKFDNKKNLIKSLDLNKKIY